MAFDGVGYQSRVLAKNLLKHFGHTRSFKELTPYTSTYFQLTIYKHSPTVYTQYLGER